MRWYFLSGPLLSEAGSELPAAAGSLPLPQNCSRSAPSSPQKMLLPALALSSAFLAPHAASRALSTSKVAMNGGKGFGGGEATRDPAPTVIDPNDPKGKQQAIHKAESFAEYLAKRSAGGGAAPAAVGSAVPTPNAGTRWSVISPARGCRPPRRLHSRRPLTRCLRRTRGSSPAMSRQVRGCERATSTLALQRWRTRPRTGRRIARCYTRQQMYCSSTRRT